MKKGKKTAWMLVGSVLVLVLALSVTAVFAQAGDDDNTPDDETTIPAPLWGWPGERGFHNGLEGISSDDELLADALNITVEELQAAKAEAQAARLAEMVDAGYITQEQADLVLAQQALAQYIDRDALKAEALGITVDELLAAREAGTSMSALLDEQGLTFTDYMTAYQAAYENAVQQAVDDGVLTEEQAAQIESRDFGFHEFGGMRGFGGGHGHHGGFPGVEGFGNFSLPSGSSTSSSGIGL